MNRALIDRALKIKALAQRGEGGERRNAEQLLASFLERNGLTLDDLSTEQVAEEAYFFRCPNQHYKKILCYIAMYLLNVQTISFHNIPSKRKIMLTLPEHVGCLLLNVWPRISKAYRATVNAVSLRQSKEMHALQTQHAKEKEILAMTFLSENDLIGESEETHQEYDYGTIAAYRKNSYDVVNCRLDKHLTNAPLELPS